MLCPSCNGLTLNLNQQDGVSELRTYNNLFDLRSIAPGCDFCHLIHEVAREMEDPEVGGYCKEKWGSLFFEGLKQSPVHVYHVAVRGEHNIVSLCKIDVTKFSSYSQGPRVWASEDPFGGIYVPSDSPVSSLIPGRPFQADLSKKDMINLAKSWYTSCATSHVECVKYLKPGFMPKRVLKLESNGVEISIRLQTVPEDVAGKYAALSYCWGKKRHSLLLTQQSLSRFSKDGIPLEQLPITLRDACELCLALGIPFLWVDSLCIVQDSKDDWDEQSAAMGQIFSRAEFTIQAAAGSDYNYGLFAKRTWTYQSTAELNCTDLQNTNHKCFVRGPPHRSARDAINSRGWTLQESLLSPRLLTFGMTEMSWGCRTLYWNESGRVLKSVLHLNNIFPQPIREKQSFSTDEDGLPSKGLKRNARQHDLWMQIVAEYCGRSLSVSTDKLPAISGLAWWFSKTLSKFEHNDYLAGLWRDHLPAGLLWYHSLPLQTNARRPEKYRAPSWSWASLDCEYLEWKHLSDDEDKIARILDCDVICQGPNCFGEVMDGRLRICAPFKQGWLLPNNLWVEHFDFCGDNWKELLAKRSPGKIDSSLGWVWLDIYPETSASDVKRAGDNEEEIATVGHCLRISMNVGLLVEPISSETDGTEKSIARKWRRLGLVSFDEERGAEWWNGSQEQELVIL